MFVETENIFQRFGCRVEAEAWRLGPRSAAFKGRKRRWR